MPRKKSGGLRPPTVPLPPLSDRRLMDQHLAQIGRLLEGQDFATIEEANAFLQLLPQAVVTEDMTSSL